MLSNIQIANPKRSKTVRGVESWFPYYAGYSTDFVSSVIQSLNIKKGSNIVDPWNGTGTTTSAAFRSEINGHGFDINPVMVIAAKACLMSSTEISSIETLSNEIVDQCSKFKNIGIENDPLETWFDHQTSTYFRRIEIVIQRILVTRLSYSFLNINESVNELSVLASFFYVALFRTIRSVLFKLKTSNPTWIKIPRQEYRIKKSQFELLKLFKAEILSMISQFPRENSNATGNIKISVASSTNSPLKDSFADYIITSPPYCTRIDYAVATMPELTILGYHPKGDLYSLRKNIMGSSTVPKIIPKLNTSWGNECMAFLDKVYHHDSKASKGYYFKNHLQYFDALFQSIGEIDRVLKDDGKGILVIQDSFYKEIYNDLPKIVIEMFQSFGLTLSNRVDFSAKNMARINPDTRRYRHSFNATESVLFFSKF